MQSWNAVSHRTWCVMRMASISYCRLWWLKPSPMKTVTSVFHLLNTSAARELRVHMEGQQLWHDPNPVYLDVTLDRTLSYRQYLTKTAGKLQSRNSLLMKLAGSSWGANANTLRSSALALCYSVAECCCPVWQRSTHVSLVDAQLHFSMRLISGTIWSTPLPWLPILTNIEPPALRCRADTNKLITQAECHRYWPLYDDIFHPPPLHLESHKPLWRDLQTIDVTSRWREDWLSDMVVNSTLVVDPTIQLPVLVFTGVNGHCWIVFGQARATVMCAQEMGFHWQRTMWLWRNPDNVTHRQLLSIDQIWWQSTALTWSRWGCRWLV